MRTKRLLLIAAGVLAAILLSFYFLHAHHRAEAATDATAAPPAVSVATAHTGFIANQLTVAGVFQAFQEIDVTERSPAISGTSMWILATAYIRGRRSRCSKSRSCKLKLLERRRV
jgi:multidrug efflux pump subunit AcrA (membrane-fusion protein)